MWLGELDFNCAPWHVSIIIKQYHYHIQAHTYDNSTCDVNLTNGNHRQCFSADKLSIS
jgi:hypothetical protein